MSPAPGRSSPSATGGGTLPAGWSWRTYAGGDEAAVVQCWNRSLPQDPVTLGRFVRTTLLDANFDEAGLVLGCDWAGHVGAFASAVADGGGDGWITSFAVDPAFRRRSVGRELLARAESHLAARGCRRVTVSGYPPGYYLPGVDPDRYPAGAALLASAGYEVPERAAAMQRSLWGYAPPPGPGAARRSLEAGGWWFGAAGPEHAVGLLRLCAMLSADWARVVRAALAGGVDAEQVRVAVSADGVAGFAVFGAYSGAPDRFGPFGVHPGLRRLGLGGVVLHDTLATMAARQLPAAWFLWADEREAAGRLYRRAGFDVTRRFSIYAKALV